MEDKLRIFTGNAHPALAHAICDYLHVPLGEAEVFEFSNENIFVKILDHVREADVFVVQPLCSPVNRSILELLIMVDALKRASARRITAVVPYYAYGRSDKVDQPRVPITARLIADMLQVAGAHRLLTMDLHAGQIQGFFNAPVDEITAFYTISRYFREKALENLVVVGADLGITKRARNYAAQLNASLAIIEKRRVGNTGRTEALNVIGEVEGKNALIVDDEIDTAGSLMAAVRALQSHGARDLYAASTHGILSGPAIERIRDSALKEVVITDTVPLPERKHLPKITVLSVAWLFGEAIRRVHGGGSVGHIYDVDGGSIWPLL